MKKMISVCLLFVLLLAGSLWIDQTMRSSEKAKPEEVAEEMAADTEKMTESMSHPVSYTHLCNRWWKYLWKIWFFRCTDFICGTGLLCGII